MEKEILINVAENYFDYYHEKLEIVSYSTLGGGCINSALKLKTNRGLLFLKWNNSGPNDLFVREAESLNEFLKSENEFIVFPEPLLHKTIDQTPGYLLTSFLETGRSSSDDEKLGRGLAKLHQVKAAKYGFPHNNYCGATVQSNDYSTNWVKFYTENRISFLISLIKKARAWSSSDEKVSERFLNKVPQLLQHEVQPSLIHGDLWSGNYMYTTCGPALIDPCASYCDREFELGIMTMFGGFSQTVYDAYNEYYPLQPGWRERNLLYQLYHVLNHYFLFGGFYKSQALDIMKRYS